MGCASSRAGDESYARHPPLLEEHVYQLNLPAPPLNGFDSFMTLQWCRDVKEERDELEKLQKEAKKKKQDVTKVVPPPKKYYLCLVCKFEPYEDNKTINLQKPLPGKKLHKEPWNELPKWHDPDFMEDILANSPFFLNDAFLLEHVPTAIRKPAEYAYTEQYIAAYRHHHGQPPSADDIAAHQTHVAATILTELHQYRRNENRDAKGRDRSRTIRKLEDVLQSMEFDVSILESAEAKVVAAAKVAEEAEKAKADKAKPKDDSKEEPAADDAKMEEKTGAKSE